VSVELVLNLLAAVGGLGGLATVIGIAYWLGKKFTEIDYRFRLIEERFKTIDERFNRIDERFEEIDKRFDDLKNYIDSRINRLATAFTDYQEFFIEFLTTEGVVRERYRDVLIKEAKRVMRLATTNPLTKEEWARLKELFEKSERNELTLEEADEFLELARKVALEYGEYPEAWKLHIYATITRALLYKKYYEEKQKQSESRQEQSTQS
jgi:hypothetical protein